MSTQRSVSSRFLRRPGSRVQRCVWVLAAYGFPTLAGTQGRGSTVYVDSCAIGPGIIYNRLSLAVNGAAPGDTIVMLAGSYPESIVIDKELLLTASGGPVLVGGFYVGTNEVCVPVTVSPPSGDPPGSCAGSQEVRARVYYPAKDSAGSEVACGGPFPAVVYAHGYRDASWTLCDWSNPGPVEEDYLQADGIFTHLAAAGMIVISVDNSWGGLNYQARGSIVINAIAYLRDQNDTAGASLENAVDFQHVGLSGHSTGGLAVVYAAAQYQQWPFDSLELSDVQVRALGLVAPGWCLTNLDPPAKDIATLVIHGTNDHENQVGDGPVELYADVSGPKHLAVVTGANHFGYTDDICLDADDDRDNPSDVGGVTGQEAHRRQQRTARNYLHALFTAYLQSDAALSCHLFQRTGEQCGDPGDTTVTCYDPPFDAACGAPLCSFSDLVNTNVEVSVCSCVP